MKSLLAMMKCVMHVVGCLVVLLTVFVFLKKWKCLREAKTDREHGGEYPFPGGNQVIWTRVRRILQSDELT